MRVALVNSNRIKPPIAPIGLEYVAEAVHAAGHEVAVLDLCWEEDWQSAIPRFFANPSCGLIGVTLRNLDDCFYSSRESFLGGFCEMIKTIRAHANAPIVLGGVGFSTAPEEVMRVGDADAGVWGDGEFPFVEIANRIERNQDWFDVPNLVWKRDGEVKRNPVSYFSLNELPAMSREWVDNRRYYCEGGQLGIETKRGCPKQCIYCADPVSKGRRLRVRPPAAVVDELERLLALGCNHIHTCDSEFNLPENHAKEICKEIIRRNLGNRLRWYAYCSPTPFSRELAGLMRDAGCVGINFGTDSGDARMLKLLGRDYSADDILTADRLCHDAGMAVMFDLLLGAPGETKASMTNTVELMKRSRADRIGVALGVRVYPGTQLAAQLLNGNEKKGLVGGSNVFDPLFFLEPEVAPFAVSLIDQLIGDDERFFFFHPERKGTDYNYNANQKLVDAIQAGERGAYWDILRRCG